MILFGAGGFLFFVFFVIWVWAMIDIIVSDSTRVRNLPKIVWLILVLFTAEIGVLAWVFLGRPAPDRSETGATPSRERPPRLRRHPAADPAPAAGTTSIVTDRRSAELDRQLDEWLAHRDESPADPQTPDAPPNETT
jgi:hypothetical protein